MLGIRGPMQVYTALMCATQFIFFKSTNESNQNLIEKLRLETASLVGSIISETRSPIRFQYRLRDETGSRRSGFTALTHYMMALQHPQR